MSFDEYILLINQIDKQLQEIAELTGKQAITGIANSDNPNFVSLMKRHHSLLLKSQELTEKMIKDFDSK